MIRWDVNRAWLRAAALGACLCMTAGAAQAQLIEYVELRAEGNQAVVAVRFTTPVQYLRAVSARSGDLVQAFYAVVPTRDVVQPLDVERRVIDGGDGLPRIVVSDERDRSATSRKLVIRLDVPARFSVRAGRSNRSIELVLEGLGNAARIATARGRSRPVVPGVPAEVAPPPAAAASAPEPSVAMQAAPAEDREARGSALMQQAHAALERGDAAAALKALDALLALPPTTQTRAAQALIGEVRLRLGDTVRARVEFETYLKLYPDGDEAPRVREHLAQLPARAERRAERPRVEPTTTITSGFSQYYFGGQSQTRTQLKDTVLEGQIPQVVSDSTISATDQKQALTSVDFGWRYRDAEQDARFVFRDSYTADLMPNRPDKNILSVLYLDYKSIPTGLSARVGRQSGLGGGVLGRFDGVQVDWIFKPKWKLGAVAGVPTDTLLDARRHFYGASIDADALLPNCGGSLYVNQQVIDGEIDRRAVGTELRYVKPNASLFSSLEYDVELKGLNIASLQGLFMTEGNTTINLMYDRRATPMLMLGNALFFSPPNGAPQPRNIRDLLGMQTLDAARNYVSGTTAYMTQASAGFTTPVTMHWQAGLDLRLTNVGALAPVAEIPELANGRPGTGNLWNAGAQAIGTNLYSARDTHVVSVSVVSGPDLSGWLASYNNLSVPWPQWQLEPSLRLYQQQLQTAIGIVRTARWTPGLRVSNRIAQRWTLESDLSVEFSKTQGPTQNESATRVFYSLGFRYDY